MARLFLRFQLKSCLLLVCIVVLIAAVALVRQNFSAEYFLRALDWTGIVCIFLGCFSLFGSFAARGSFDVQFSRSAGPESLGQRSARDAKDMLGSFYYLVFFIWTGGLQLLLSMVIHYSTS